MKSATAQRLLAALTASVLYGAMGLIGWPGSPDSSIQARPTELWRSPAAPGGSGGTQNAASGKDPVLFILDASGSMAELFGGVSRMAAARLMLQEQLARLEQDVPIGLVAYGNRIPGCRSVRIYAPIRTKNRGSLKSQVKQMEPAGSTPIARTLRLIGDSVIPAHPRTTVVLISDGAESCGGNPAAEARKLLAKGKDVRINVIGLAVDQATAIELGQIAQAGQGAYYNVQNHTDLERAIQLSTGRTPGSSVDSIAELPKTETTDNPWAPTTIGPKPGPAAKHPFEITGVRVVPPAANAGANSDTVQLEISYRFVHPRQGNFIVRVHALERPAAPGPGGRVPGGDALFAIASRPHFQTDRAEGTIRIDVPKARMRAQVTLQGELWETSNVPEAIYVSNAVRARAARQ